MWATGKWQDNNNDNLFKQLHAQVYPVRVGLDVFAWLWINNQANLFKQLHA